MKPIDPTDLTELRELDCPILRLGLTYIASPYTAFTGAREWPRDVQLQVAFKLVCEAAAKFVKAGIPIFCPIAHSHPIALYGKVDPESHDIWIEQDKAVLSVCKRLVIIPMPGWRTSKGIAMELEIAKGLGIPCYLLV